MYYKWYLNKVSNSNIKLIKKCKRIKESIRCNDSETKVMRVGTRTTKTPKSGKMGLREEDSEYDLEC